MSGYGKIESSFWTEEPTRRLDGRPRELAFFFRTSHHRNLIGAMRLPTGYIEGDLGWPREAVEHAIGVLSGMGYIVRDENGWTHIPAQLTNDPPTVRNHWQAALTLAKAIPRSSPVFGSVVRQLHAMGNKHADAWAWLTNAMAMLSAGDGDAMAQRPAVASPSHANGPPHGTGELSAQNDDAKGNRIDIPAPAPAPAPPLPSVAGAAPAAPPPQAERAAKPTVKRAPKARLPADWVPDQLDIAAAASINLTGDRLASAALKFRVYWTTGRGSTRRDAAKAPKDWRTTWANWCALENEFAQARGGNRGGNRPDPATQGRQDSAAVLRGMGYRVRGDADAVDLGGEGGADPRRDAGDHSGLAAGGPEAHDGGDRPDGAVVSDVRHQHDQHRTDVHAGPGIGAAAPAGGPADPGIRDDQEYPQVGYATADAAGDRRDGEPGVSAADEDQGGVVEGEQGGSRGQALTAGAATGAGCPGGSDPGPVAIEPERVIEGEDLLDIPAFLRRTDTSVQVH